MRYIYKGGTALVQEIHQTEVADGGIAVWSLGQMGIVLKGSQQDGFICIDPYLTNSIEQENPGTEFVREYPPPIAPEGLTDALAVLITHYHNDHLDLATLRALAAASPSTSYAVPASHLSLLQNAAFQADRLIAARDEASFSIGNFAITPVAAAHPDYQT